MLITILIQATLTHAGKVLVEELREAQNKQNDMFTLSRQYRKYGIPTPEDLFEKIYSNYTLWVKHFDGLIDQDKAREAMYVIDVKFTQAMFGGGNSHLKYKDIADGEFLEESTLVGKYEWKDLKHMARGYFKDQAWWLELTVEQDELLQDLRRAQHEQNNMQRLKTQPRGFKRNAHAALFFWRQLSNDDKEDFRDFWYGDVQFFHEVRNLLDFETFDVVNLDDNTIVGSVTWGQRKREAMKSNYMENTWYINLDEREKQILEALRAEQRRMQSWAPLPNDISFRPISIKEVQEVKERRFTVNHNLHKSYMPAK